MLQAMRKGATTWVAKILFGLLVLSFGLWGLDGLSSQQDPEIISVGDVSVRLSEIDTAFQRSTTQMRGLFGNDFSLQQAVQLGFLDRTIDQLADSALFTAFSSSMGLAVTDERLVAEIRKNPAFIGPTGQFERAQYELALAQAGLSEAAFVNMIRDDLIRLQVLGSLERGTRISETYAKMLAAHRLEQRTISAARVDAELVTELHQPTPDELTAFYTENLPLFTTRQTRSYDVLDLSVPALATQLVIPEDDLRAEYDFMAPSLGQPEKRSLLQVLLDNEAQARALTERIQQTGDLTSAAEALSLPAPINLGYVEESDLVPELVEHVFGTPSLDSIGPVQSSFGWHVVEITDIQEADIPSFEDVRAQMQANVASRMAEESMFDITAMVEDELDQGLTLQAIAEKNNLPLISIAASDAGGLAMDTDGLTTLNSHLDKLGQNARDILQTAFDTEAGLNSGILEGLQGGYYVVHVNRVDEARQLAQEDVSQKLLNEWQKATRLTLAQKIAEDMTQTGQSADLRSDHPAATLLPPETLARGASSASLPAPVLELAFNTAQGETATSPASGTAFYVVKVDAIIPATPDAITTAITEEQQNRQGTYTTDLFTQLRNQLQLDLGIVVDRTTAQNYYNTQ